MNEVPFLPVVLCKCARDVFQHNHVAPSSAHQI